MLASVALFGSQERRRVARSTTECALPVGGYKRWQPHLTDVNAAIVDRLGQFRAPVSVPDFQIDALLRKKTKKTTLKNVLQMGC